uniref:Uncharacterized protein n=1 Tax=Aegilops tauschii subsp. strangulata TaxID=200361 RepID=A0A453HC74_AEGTS
HSPERHIVPPKVRDRRHPRPWPWASPAICIPFSTHPTPRARCHSILSSTSRQSPCSSKMGSPGSCCSASSRCAMGVVSCRRCRLPRPWRKCRGWRWPATAASSISRSSPTTSV